MSEHVCKNPNCASRVIYLDGYCYVDFKRADRPQRTTDAAPKATRPARKRAAAKKAPAKRGGAK